MAVLRANIGGATVFAREGERRLWLLDECSTVLWDLLQAGPDVSLIAGALAQRFGMDLEAAHRYVGQLVAMWREAGLLDESPHVGGEDPFEPLPTFPSPGGTRIPPGAWWLTIAEQPIAVQIEAADLRATLEPLLASLRCRSPLSGSATADFMSLSGPSKSWQLSVNDAEAEAGSGLDAAMVATLSALTELGSRTRERLLVVHGAGLIAPDGRCLMLVAPGGYGKSTLATALDARGFHLLSDDVVPVRSDGTALGLGLPACIKRGSWQALASTRPDIQQATEIIRFGQKVRLLPSRSRLSTGPVTPSFLLYPEFRLGADPECTPLAPESALQRLIEADAIIRDLTQEKLEALCRWVDRIPAYSLTYPDLTSGTELVRSVISCH